LELIAFWFSATLSWFDSAMVAYLLFTYVIPSSGCSGSVVLHLRLSLVVTEKCDVSDEDRLHLKV
jgi:hypothetical protein